MPRDDDDDDRDEVHDEYDPDDVNEPPFPGMVLIAIILWCLTAFIQFSNWVLWLLIAGGIGDGNCCGMLIGLAFASIGYNTMIGRVADTRGIAIGAILYSACLLGFAVLLTFIGVKGMNQAPPGGGLVCGRIVPAGMNARHAVVLSVELFGIGVALMMSGVLALMGRTQYLEWRAYHFPKKGRRRRTEDYEDDDRP